MIVPALLTAVDRHLDGPAGPPPGLAEWTGRPRLPLPAGLDPARLTRVRGLLATGRPVPEKLAHALEVAGELAYRAPGVRPSASGAVGASPAATAAWLGGPEPGPALDYLNAVARPGPVPCASPITVFERAWVLGILVRAGVPVGAPEPVLTELRAAVGPAGAATAPGLPADADTTAVTLYALARLGRAPGVAPLAGFDTGRHFCTWPGEDGASLTTNAHVLDALGEQPSAPGVTGARRRVTEWLLGRQEPDGRWEDRWHASPYYATYAVLLALADHAPDGAARAAVERGVPGCWTRSARTAPGDGGTAPPRRPRTRCSPWPTRAGPATPGSRRRWRGGAVDCPSWTDATVNRHYGTTRTSTARRGSCAPRCWRPPAVPGRPGTGPHLP